MKKKIARNALVALILLTIFSISASAKTLADVPRMTKEDLRNRIGDENIIVIDVRTEYDWVNSDLKISGAVRQNPQDVLAWGKKYAKEKTLVLYCA